MKTHELFRFEVFGKDTFRLFSLVIAQVKI
jgi:hypothetical protein